MDSSAFLNALVSTQTPLLPDPAAMRWALHGAWGIVLGSGVMLLAIKMAPRYRWGLGLLALVWALLPGALSAAHWLGLAFQTPSWTSVLLCLAWLLKRASPANQVTAHQVVAVRARNVLMVTGIVLGWVLLLDALAWLPVSLYSWGFSPLAVAAVGSLAALFLAVFGGVPDAASWVRCRQLRWLPAMPLLVLALFVLTRLPSGNLWDALIDPWLWLLLQVSVFFSVARHRRPARLPAATRA